MEGLQWRRREGVPVSTRILIIEDNRDHAESLRCLLRLMGYDVQVSYSGLEGLQTAIQWVPDIVLSDIVMPELDGYQVASLLRQHPVTAQVRLIAITAYGCRENRDMAFVQGFDEHLTKPVDPTALLRLLSPE